MYIEEFVLVEYLDTLLYKLELSMELVHGTGLTMHRKCSNLYTRQQWKRKDEIALRCTIDTVE